MSNKKQQVRLSASAINEFKACPTRYRLKYFEGIRDTSNTPAQRMGTNWHEMHEVYQKELIVHDYTPDGMIMEDWAMGKVDELINKRYSEAQAPSWVPIKEWEWERTVLQVSFYCYYSIWEHEPIIALGCEVPFHLPLHNPRLGTPKPISEVVRLGKIDHVALWKARIVNVERKSTTKAIEPGGRYWEKSDKDVQVSMYSLAMKDMIEGGTLPDDIVNHELFDPTNVGNTLYDVWRKPSIKPKKISQKDTVCFMELQKYYDAEFEVIEYRDDAGATIRITVDEVEAEFEWNKKGDAYAIIETIDMYAARLANDIYKNPDYFFQRKELVRTDKDLHHFRQELWNVYKAIRLFIQTDCWYENESACRATFTCSYIPLCSNNLVEEVCANENAPEGFRRSKRTTLTIEGKTQ